MARIRTVKPTIWGDERICQLTLPERLFFIGIISTADDAGRFIATPVALSGTIFPLDDIPPATIKKWRQHLVDQGLIRLYKVGPHEYGHLPNWLKHQRIDRAQPSSLPEPPSSGSPPPDPPTSEGFAERFVESRDDHSSNDSTGEGNGRDRKGITPLPAQSTGCPIHPNKPHSNCRSCRTNPRAVREDTAKRGPWCGACDESTRLFTDEHGDNPTRCSCATPVALRAVQ
jgi:hypothetical protein